MYFYLAAILLAASSVVIPKSAMIMVLPGQQVSGCHLVGNVKVVFTDGHSEMWTKHGNCLLPQVSQTGLVGWTRFQTRNERGILVNDTLRICWPNGHHKDFDVAKDAPYPFIEKWDFADNDKTVVVKSRGSHGPAFFIKYDIMTGAIIGQANAQLGTDLPVWAQPYSD